MKIEILDHANITLDGEAAGSVADVLHNHGHREGLRGALVKALQDWHAGLTQAHKTALDDLARHATETHQAALQQRQERHAAQIQEQADHHTNQIAQLKSQHSKAIVAARAQAETHRARAAELQSLVEALGGTEAAIKLRRHAERRQIQEAMARHTARLAALDAEEATAPTAPAAPEK